MELKPVDMGADTFTILKADMTGALNRLIRNMIEFKSEKAAMTVKVTVEMIAAGNEIVPRFTNKVSCTVQQKDEVDGELHGKYTLGRDEDGVYYLRQEQTELFD